MHEALEALKTLADYDVEFDLDDLLNQLAITNPDDPELALANSLSTFDVEHDCGDIYSADGNEYRVLTDDEADDAMDEALEKYLDDCVEGAQGPYFDRDAWKRDAAMDGRGHYLAIYDSEEVESGEFFIYRLS